MFILIHQNSKKRDNNDQWSHLDNKGSAHFHDNNDFCLIYIFPFPRMYINDIYPLRTVDKYVKSSGKR